MPDGWRSGGKRVREEEEIEQIELDLERKGKFRNFKNEVKDSNSQGFKRIKIQLVNVDQDITTAKRPID